MTVEIESYILNVCENDRKNGCETRCQCDGIVTILLDGSVEFDNCYTVDYKDLKRIQEEAESFFSWLKRRKKI